MMCDGEQKVVCPGAHLILLSRCADHGAMDALYRRRPAAGACSTGLRADDRAVPRLLQEHDDLARIAG